MLKSDMTKAMGLQEMYPEMGGESRTYCSQGQMWTDGYSDGTGRGRRTVYRVYGQGRHEPYRQAVGSQYVAPLPS